MDVKKGIFQGNLFSLLLFVIIIIPLSLNQEGYKINHLLFTNDF